MARELKYDGRGDFMRIVAWNEQVFYFEWDSVLGTFERARDRRPAHTKALTDDQYRELVYQADAEMRMHRVTEALRPKTTLAKLLGQAKAARIAREKETGIMIPFQDFLLDFAERKLGKADAYRAHLAMLRLQGRQDAEVHKKRKAAREQAARQGKLAI